MAQNRSAGTTPQEEIDRLKTEVRLRQEQIDELRKRVDAQQKILERFSLGQQLSLVNILPS